MFSFEGRRDSFFFALLNNARRTVQYNIYVCVLLLLLLPLSINVLIL